MKPYIYCNKLVYVTLLNLMFCFALSTQEKILQIRKPVFEHLQQHATACAKENGVSAEILPQVLKWSIPKDLVTKKFLFCLAHNSGYADENGHVVVEKTAVIPVLGGDKEELTMFLKECNKITLETKFDTIYAMGDCIHKDYIFQTLEDNS